MEKPKKDVEQKPKKVLPETNPLKKGQQVLND